MEKTLKAENILAIAKDSARSNTRDGLKTLVDQLERIQNHVAGSIQYYSDFQRQLAEEKIKSPRQLQQMLSVASQKIDEISWELHSRIDGLVGAKNELKNAESNANLVAVLETIEEID